jgi:predicted DCC family thiol-disulfide oxidoreductase YuxK
VTGISYFDWAKRMTYTDLESQWQWLHQKHPEITLDNCRREMHLLMPNNQVYKGYFAFRQIWKQLPVYWPLAALTYLPFASTIGPRVYSWVAAHRRRFRQDCDTGLCLIHSPVNK